MTLLSANSIVKKYHQHVALNDISIEVTENSIFGLLGPNGAGKTSLIRIINQITAPDSGEILFKGKKLAREHVSFFGYLPEERGLYKKMAVGEQALYLAQLKGLSKHDALQRLKYWFDKLDIGSWWNKKIEELSKGMQQKVQFAVTVLHQPEFLVLDEPFSGFDPVNAHQIKQEILTLNKQGTTIMLSTHNMASVEELCHEIVLIHQSQKVLDGRVADIKKHHRTNTYRVDFKGNMIAFTNAIWTGCELLSHQSDAEQNSAVVRLLHHATTNQLLQALIPHVEILAIKELVPDMNDIFLSAVKAEASSSYTE